MACKFLSFFLSLSFSLFTSYTNHLSLLHTQQLVGFSLSLLLSNYNTLALSLSLLHNKHIQGLDISRVYLRALLCLLPTIGNFRRQVPQPMEIFSRRRRRHISAQMSNKFGNYPSWTVSIVLVFHKQSSLPLGLHLSLAVVLYNAT